VITIDGEECRVDAVKDPRIGRPEPWHARGNCKKQYLMAKGPTIAAAFEAWEKKARAL
jgi:hypothetical protein